METVFIFFLVFIFRAKKAWWLWGEKRELFLDQVRHIAFFISRDKIVINLGRTDNWWPMGLYFYFTRSGKCDLPEIMPSHL